MHKDEGTDINTHKHTHTNTHKHTQKQTLMHTHTHTHKHKHSRTHTHRNPNKQTNIYRNVECYMIIWKEDDKWVKVDRRVMYYTKYMVQIFQKTKEQTGTILM